MDHGEALTIVLGKYRISAKQLSRWSGVNENQISRLRNGKDLYTATWLDLVGALPSGARNEYLYLVLGESLEVGVEEAIAMMSPEKLAKILNLVSQSLRKNAVEIETAIATK